MGSERNGGYRAGGWAAAPDEVTAVVQEGVTYAARDEFEQPRPKRGRGRRRNRRRACTRSNPCAGCMARDRVRPRPSPASSPRFVTPCSTRAPLVPNPSQSGTCAAWRRTCGAAPARGSASCTTSAPAPSTPATPPRWPKIGSAPPPSGSAAATPPPPTHCLAVTIRDAMRISLQ